MRKKDGVRLIEGSKINAQNITSKLLLIQFIKVSFIFESLVKANIF